MVGVAGQLVTDVHLVAVDLLGRVLAVAKVREEQWQVGRGLTERLRVVGVAG